MVTHWGNTIAWLYLLWLYLLWLYLLWLYLLWLNYGYTDYGFTYYGYTYYGYTYRLYFLWLYLLWLYLLWLYLPAILSMAILTMAILTMAVLTINLLWPCLLWPYLLWPYLLCYGHTYYGHTYYGHTLTMAILTMAILTMAITIAVGLHYRCCLGGALRRQGRRSSRGRLFRAYPPALGCKSQKFGLEGWGVNIGNIYGTVTVFFRLKIVWKEDPVNQVCVSFAVYKRYWSLEVSKVTKYVPPPQHAWTIRTVSELWCGRGLSSPRWSMRWRRVLSCRIQFLNSCRASCFFLGHRQS
jgi:hypothetical protein